jgi:hypothetical protein
MCIPQATRARLHTQHHPTTPQHPTPRCVSYSRVLLPGDEEQLLAGVLTESLQNVRLSVLRGSVSFSPYVLVRWSTCSSLLSGAPVWCSACLVVVWLVLVLTSGLV